MPPKIIIIDGSSYIFRAYYGIRQALTTSKGVPANATYGFARMLLKVIRDEKPEYVAVVFDSKGKTTRHGYFPEYKANRSAMPDDLVPQIPYIHDLVRSFNVEAVCRDGIEADDIIGTLAMRSREKGMEVTIVSGDKDMMQLIGDGVTMLDTMKDKRYGPGQVVEKLGVGPDKVIEIMGLMGDSSDNIPGVPGVGPKTALELIKQFGDLESAIAHADEIRKKSVREKMSQFADQARLSKRLVTIVTDLDLGIDHEVFRSREIDREAVVKILKELEFNSLMKELDLSPTPAEKHEKTYKTILDWEGFDELVDGLGQSDRFALDLETTSKHPVEAKIVGISFSFKPHEAYYIPLAHEYLGCPKQLNFKMALEKLKPVLEDPALKKIGQNIKYEIIVLQNAGIRLQGVDFDTMVASYLLEPNKRHHNLGDIALEHLGHKMISYMEVAGKGQKQIGFQEVEIERASEYSCEDADITFLLAGKLKPMIKDGGLEDLFRNLEMPLVHVLAEMELNGTPIDGAFLGEMSKKLEIELDLLTGKVYEIAGMEFNINSPKQLAEILFEKFKLPAKKKTKSGYSTDEGVLESLAEKHPLPAEVLNYRKLKKLKSTYVDALPALIKPDTGRVHTSFNQTVTATGRLSSTDPNLQNIPIQTKIGREVRKAFTAGEGSLILSADYSQVELRLLAHLSADETLMDAFRRGDDIHTRTASEVFNLLPGMVSPEMRRMAKAVNFGIIYGMGPYRLSREIGVSLKEAKAFIENYFRLYKNVKTFTEEIVKKARVDGYVSTIMGRRRTIPELTHPSRNQQEFGERIAVNTPIQGSAADLIKLAMINISGRLKEEGLKSKMMIQVHDELVFEVPEEEKEAMERLVKTGMEEVYPLKVPLVVDLGFGRNWKEAH